MVDFVDFVDFRFTDILCLRLRSPSGRFVFVGVSLLPCPSVIFYLLLFTYYFPVRGQVLSVVFSLRHRRKTRHPLQGS